MIKLISVHFGFGSRAILDDQSWMLGDNDRVGLVGENGSGKSTLIKIMAGLQEVDRGKIEATRGLRLGYLPQQGITHQGKTLLEEVREAIKPILALQEEHQLLEQKLGSGSLPLEEQNAVLHRMTELLDQFHIHDGYELEAKLSRVLNGLGFRDQDRDRPVETFSGGWQMRIALAKLLLGEPQVLLLDEPTNHLDLDARNWLEEYLREFPGAYLLVSHDRYFLDVTADRIVEIENGVLSDYRGNFSRYLEAKEKRVEAARVAYERQQDEIHRLKAFINKYKADKKRAGQIQSRAKMLEKIVPLEPPREQKPIRFRFPPAPPSPRDLIRLQAAGKSYGELTVLAGVDLILFRGEKVALVGPNGSGKSTLLGLLAGRKKTDAGSREENERVEIAFFGQDAGEDLEPADTVLEAISRNAPFDQYPRLRALLGAFLFRGDDIDKRVSSLSGGEKSRLALARLLLRPANLLLLDEPTNHLDLRAKEVLMDAFRNFTGTLVFVAHDRYFLEGLPDRILEVRDAHVESFIGNYSDYLRAKARLAATAAGKANENKTSGKSEAEPNEDAESDRPALSKAERMRLREEDKARHREEQKRKKRLAALETEISATEQKLRELERVMADPRVACDYLKLMELERERVQLAERLGALLGEWELGQAGAGRNGNDPSS